MDLEKTAQAWEDTLPDSGDITETNGDSSVTGTNLQSGTEDFLTLKHLGVEKPVTRDEAVVLAQKGLDYDRIRERYDRLRTTAANASGDPVAFKRSVDIDEFLQDYPDVEPKSIPAEVWREVRNGRSLTTAYARWENGILKDQLEAGIQNKTASQRTTGSRVSSGKNDEHDDFVTALLAE